MEFDRARLMNNINTLIKDKKIKIGELENSIGISTGYLSKILDVPMIIFSNLSGYWIK